MHMHVVYHFFHLDNCLSVEHNFFFFYFSKKNKKKIPCNIDPATTDHVCLGMLIEKHALSGSTSLGNCDKQRNAIVLLYISKCYLLSIFLT